MYKQIDSNKRKSVLLIVFFVVIIALLGAAFGQVYDDSGAFLVGAFVLASVSAVGSYYFSDKIVLAASGARQITVTDAPDIYHLVENLCITGGLPVPRVYIISDPAMNAFATGRDPEHAAIALTTGIIERLDRSELEGVIAHELSHVKNLDIRFATLVVVLVGTISLLADWFLRFSFFGGRRRGGSDRESGQMGTIFALIGLVLAILAPLAAQLVQLAISRKREFLADASGALLTRYPQGLASALAKISQDPSHMRHVNRATAPLYFSNPFRGARVAGLFSTHPPIQERIAELEKMANAR